MPQKLSNLEIASKNYQLARAKLLAEVRRAARALEAADLEDGLGRLRAEVARLQLAVGGYGAGKRVDPEELDRALGELDQ